MYVICQEPSRTAYKERPPAKSFALFSFKDVFDPICHIKTNKAAVSKSICALTAILLLFAFIVTSHITVLRIHSNSMSPTIKKHQIAVALKMSDFSHQDIAAFYHDNKILIRRIIAVSGDMVNIDKEGDVYVNNNLLDEPYLEEKHKEYSTILLPYKVPDGSYFVMGDNRLQSIDSSNPIIGSISSEKFIGKIIFTI